MTEKNIGIGGVNVRPERMRALRPEVVSELAESIRERGLINPITVRPRESGGYWLVAGRHRLTACKKLKRATIRASILENMAADEAELIEIDENLVRADLTPIERDLHMARRKELYEDLHPETKHGAAPGAGKGKGKRRKDGTVPSFQEDTAKKTGVHKRTVERSAARGALLAEIPNGRDAIGTVLDTPGELRALVKLIEWPKELQKVIQQAVAAKTTGKKVSAKLRLKQLKREEREKELGAKQLAFPTKEYGVIVCDDAWDFEPWSRETGMDRHAANHYVVEDAHTAAELHKATKDRFKCAAKDCLLAMWATVPHLAVAVDLLRLRGFRYVSNYTWGKHKAGTGHWNRNKHETLLLGVRGNVPCPAPGKQWDSLQMAPATKHSAKPELFLKMLEEYFPNLPKIELNRRGKSRDGWDAWGNEAVQEAAE